MARIPSRRFRRYAIIGGLALTLALVIGALDRGFPQRSCEGQEADPATRAAEGASICLPDEREAQRRYEQDPSEATRMALARVRLFRALDFAALSQASRNPELLQLAAVYAESCTQLAPEAAWSWILLGRMLRATRNDITGQSLAEAAFTRALLLEPANAEALILRGTTLADAERWDEAIVDLEKAVSSPAVKATPDLVTLLTSAYLLSFEDARGVRFFAAKLAVDPSNDAARLGRAILMNHGGDRPGALAELARVEGRAGAPEGLRTYARVLRASFDQRSAEEGR